MKQFICIVILAILVSTVFLALGMTQSRCGMGCGIIPLSPVAPLGCKRLDPVCVCDEKGCNCHWEWHCVPYDRP